MKALCRSTKGQMRVSGGRGSQDLLSVYANHHTLGQAGTTRLHGHRESDKEVGSILLQPAASETVTCGAFAVSLLAEDDSSEPLHWFGVSSVCYVVFGSNAANLNTLLYGILVRSRQVTR